MSQSQCGRSPSQAGYPYALVGRYPTNKLMGREFLPKRQAPKGPHLWLRQHSLAYHIRY